MSTPVKKFPESGGLVSDIEDYGRACRNDDEEPPLHGENLLKKQKSALLPACTLPTDWYLNPFVLLLGMVALLWFLYILIVSCFTDGISGAFVTLSEVSLRFNGATADAPLSCLPRTREH